VIHAHAHHPDITVLLSHAQVPLDAAARVRFTYDEFKRQVAEADGRLNEEEADALRGRLATLRVEMLELIEAFADEPD
jgi:hypothetical protein